MRWSAMPSLRASASTDVQARRTRRFDRDLAGTPPSIQRVFEKQPALLLSNPRHPSLRAKKYDEARGIWQARVTRDWRFYFIIEAGAYMLRTIRSHPK
jgi:hypothetical protein